MNNSKINTSKVLLIILGVLVAIVIGFNSKAIGAKSMVKFQDAPAAKIESKAKKILKESSLNITNSVVDFFTHQ